MTARDDLAERAAKAIYEAKFKSRVMEFETEETPE